jgi:hypothetical protein
MAENTKLFSIFASLLLPSSPFPPGTSGVDKSAQDVRPKPAHKLKGKDRQQKSE